MIRRIVFAACLAALASTRLAAQIAPETVRGIAPGTRIRVSAVAAEDRMASRDANDKRWRVGVLREVTEDGLVLQTSPGRTDALVTLPFGVIQDVEVSGGRLDLDRGVRRGMLQGAFGGAALGSIVIGGDALFSGTRCTGIGCESGSRRDRNLAILLGGTAVGTAIGALVGSSAREVWRPAARHVTVSSAASGGTGLGLSFRF